MLYEEGFNMNRLRLKILEKYHSQANFALELKVDESVISRVLHGRRGLTEENREKWAKALECDPAVLESVTNKANERR
jgi:transcriptional regulator with XRE-family HTH domain